MYEEKNAEYYNDAYNSRDEYKTPYEESIYFPMWKELLKMLPDGRILEVGCGTGQFAHYLQDNDIKDYKGFDFSKKAIEIARSFSKQDFVVADAYDKTTFQNYDTIVLNEVLEHLCDYKILDNIDKGTMVYFTLPSFDDPAHMRFFKHRNDVVARYHTLFEDLEVIVFDKWYICYGRKK